MRSQVRIRPEEDLVTLETTQAKLDQRRGGSFEWGIRSWIHLQVNELQLREEVSVSLIWRCDQIRRGVFDLASLIVDLGRILDLRRSKF